MSKSADDRIKTTVAFPNRRTALSARDRLVRGGFSKNSTNIYRRDDAYVVVVKAHPDRVEQAERILHASPLEVTLQERPWITWAVAALAGYALFHLIPQNRVRN